MGERAQEGLGLGPAGGSYLWGRTRSRGGRGWELNVAERAE